MNSTHSFKIPKCIKLLVIFITTLTLVSCEKQNQSKDFTPNDIGKHLIERGKYTEAIQLLEPYVVSNSLDYELRILLASAYAARAGVMINSYVPFAQELIRSTEDFNRIFNNRSSIFLNLKDQFTKNIISTLDSIYKTLWQLNDFFRTFDFIPTIEETKINDLNRAISILNEIDSLSKGGFLYRALLQVSKLKYNIKAKYYFVELQKCKFNVKSLSTQLLGIRADLKPILKDLSSATKDTNQKNELNKALGQLDGQFANTLESISQIPNNDNLDISEVVKQLGGSCE